MDRDRTRRSRRVAMVTGADTTGTYRVTSVRFQASGRGSILSADRLDRAVGEKARTILRIPSSICRGARSFHPGQTVIASGKIEPWRDPRTGEQRRQLVVSSWHEVRPRGAAWIDFVAGNPDFVGIGRATATRIWESCGVDLFTMLADGDPAAFTGRVPQFPHGKARLLLEAWSRCGHERLIRWLDGHALPRRLCQTLIRAYDGQDAAVERLSSDPYRLLAFGLDWSQVDELALGTFGIAADDPRRLHAAVVACLMRDYRRGSTAATSQTLTASVAQALGMGHDSARRALCSVYADGGFVRVAPDLFQLRGVHVMERAVAADIARRIATPEELPMDHGLRRSLSTHRRDSRSRFTLTERQMQAVSRAAELPFSIIIGGAGTGKTACLAALHDVVDAVNQRPGGVLQMALAGRAAKRLREATGREAVTIAGFLHTLPEEHIAQTTHVVIDEASMLDVPSFHAVLRRLRGRTRIVLVGDEFQLPPIGGGKILHLLTKSHDVPVTVLDTIWRQEEGSSIRTVAGAVRSGSMPDLPVGVLPDGGVSLVHPGDDIAATACEVFTGLGGADPATDVCVLSPHRRAGAGSAAAINAEIHRRHFATGDPVCAGPIDATHDTGFNVGDRFVCDVNHWDADLMNGTLGRILRAATPGEIEEALHARAEKDDGVPVVLAEVDGKNRLLDDRHLADCSWGYALTCHRAQGSDFDGVVVVLDERADRSWLYTAITRGRRKVVLIGTPEQLARMVGNAPAAERRLVALDVLLNEAISCSKKERADGRLAA